MLLFKRISKIFSAVICLIVLCCGLSLNTAFAQPSEEFYLGGFPAGFILNTQNVEVVGLCDIFTESGAVCPARDCGIKSGDIIKSINGIQITSSAQLTQTLTESFSTYNLVIQRGSETQEIKINPLIDKSTGAKKLGLLVKDSINGIGTITYIDKANNKFGSLGHPVTDVSGALIPINGGCLYGCSIYDVKKGVRGNPGELKGIFDNSKMFGVITDNTRCGIFGDISSDFDTTNLIKINKGTIGEACMGKAYIYSTLGGDTCEQYEISIVKVDEGNKDNRNYVIKISDKRILDKSGGIVQGMSGSPIVQNGKLIGAVTHVFVNDPTRGYGISIDKMLNAY